MFWLGSKIASSPALQPWFKVRSENDDNQWLGSNSHCLISTVCVRRTAFYPFTRLLCCVTVKFVSSQSSFISRCVFEWTTAVSSRSNTWSRTRMARYALSSITAALTKSSMTMTKAKRHFRHERNDDAFREVAPREVPTPGSLDPWRGWMGGGRRPTAFRCWLRHQ